MTDSALKLILILPFHGGWKANCHAGATVDTARLQLTVNEVKVKVKVNMDLYSASS